MNQKALVIATLLVAILLINVLNTQNTCQMDKELMSKEYNDLKAYKPKISCGKVIKVYDGDTITIGARVGGVGDIYRFSVRVNGIDSAEMRTKNGEEKEIAILARDSLSKLILNQVVTLEDVGYDKYGRILATLFYNHIDIAKWMISNRLAVEYHGGTKHTVDWKKYYQTGQL